MSARLTVICNNAGEPVRFRWRGKWHLIEEVLEKWKDNGEWWKGESPKMFFRVLATRGVWEIFRDLESNEWALYRRYD